MSTKPEEENRNPTCKLCGDYHLESAKRKIVDTARLLDRQTLFSLKAQSGMVLSIIVEDAATILVRLRYKDVSITALA